MTASRSESFRCGPTHHMACACREAQWLSRFAEMEQKLAAAERRAEEAEKSRDVAVAQVAGRPTWDDLQFATDQVNAAELKAEGEREFRRRAESSLASERAARERAERERDVLRAANREAESQFVAELEAKRTAESSLSRAVEALRGAEAHHDEQARLWADNESDGEADLNAQYHSERRDVFKAVLVEVGK